MHAMSKSKMFYRSAETGWWIEQIVSFSLISAAVIFFLANTGASLTPDR